VAPLSAALSELEALHREIDERAAALWARHAGRLRCALGCADCCQDELSLFEIEAELIRHRHPELFARSEPHPPGKCALLGRQGACRVYADRPYVCRTQGLPLRWLQEGPAGLVEHRDVCPLNLTEVSLLALDEADLWLLGPYEGRLADIQHRAFGPSLGRVRLRDLFAH
jgi:hypothetical protein